MAPSAKSAVLSVYRFFCGYNCIAFGCFVLCEFMSKWLYNDSQGEGGRNFWPGLGQIIKLNVMAAKTSEMSSLFSAKPPEANMTAVIVRPLGQTEVRVAEIAQIQKYKNTNIQIHKYSKVTAVIFRPLGQTEVWNSN